MEGQQRTRVLLVLFAGVLMGALDIAIIGPALPALEDYFGVNERLLSWTISVYVLFNLVGAPLMAKLSDIHGRRRVYAANASLFALGSIVVAVAPTFAVLLAGRAIQGLGSGGIFPVASAVIGDTFPVQTRGKALGLLGAVFGLAFLIGPIVGGVLLGYGWQWLFLLNVPLAAVILAASLRVLPDTRSDHPAPFDRAGMVLLALTLAALALGVNLLDTGSLSALFGSRAAWTLLLAALVLAWRFARVERAAEDPVLNVGLLSSRQIALVSVIAVGAGASEAAVEFVPSMLELVFGVTYRQAAFMLLPVVIAMAVGAPLAGIVLDRRGSRLVIVVSCAVLAAGMASVSFIDASLARFYAAAILVGLALAALLGAPLRYVMLSEARAESRASAQGALSLFNNGGLLVGSALMGAVIGSLGGDEAAYATAFLAVAVVAAAMTALGLGLKSRHAELTTARERS